MQPMEPINVSDYEAQAQGRLHQSIWDFYQGGSGDEVTLRGNRAAFERIRLRPRVLVDVSQCDIRTSVLGIPVSMPILVAPTAAHRMAHPDGECATAWAAGDAGTLMTVSSSASRSIEDIAQAASGPLWFQLYIDTYDQAKNYVQRAEAAGYRAIVLTVDLPRLGTRERDVRNSFRAYQAIHMPDAFIGHDVLLNTTVVAGRRAENGMVDNALYVGDTLTWETLDWIRSLTSLPIILKGILTAEDAELAVQHQVAGIIVSNHGGRQLDSVPPTIEVLPEVVQAVAGRCEVYLDGGIRRGTDVLKALALGANAVLIGRPVLWGLIVNGQVGVRHVLQLLHDEFRLAMILAGCPNMQSIKPSLVKVV